MHSHLKKIGLIAFVFSVPLKTKAQNFDLLLKGGLASYTGGTRNLKVHESAINFNTKDISKEMNTSPFGAAFGFEVVIRNKGDRRFGVFAGWNYRRNTFRATTNIGGKLAWRFATRRLTVFGMFIQVSKKFDVGYSFDLMQLRFLQNAENFNVSVYGKKTDNSGGWEHFYQPKEGGLRNAYRAFGATVFANYNLNKLLNIRLTYIHDFFGVTPYLLEDPSKEFKYYLSQLELGVNLKVSGLFKKEKGNKK